MSGSSGQEKSGLDSKSKNDRKLPVMARRQGEIVGQEMLNLTSSSWMTEVWSNTSDTTMLPAVRDKQKERSDTAGTSLIFTNAPLVHGEITMAGTLKPRPMGAGTSVSMLRFTSPSTVTVDTPSAAESGGVGVQWWSKNWPPSS